MKEHKYEVGTLVCDKSTKFLGYIQSRDESFYGEPIYDIYWFKDEYVSHNLHESHVKLSVQLFKEKYGFPNR